jgi:addiction module RelE/StbE family toxin
VRRVLIQSPAFVRAAKRFTKKQPAATEAIRQTLDQLHADAFDPKLRTHKLKGDLAGHWASSAGYDLRIVFQLVQHGGSEAILLLSVGTHDEVY